MAPERKRKPEEALVAKILSAKEEPTVTILTLMTTYNFSIETLMDYLTEKEVDVNFSRVSFSDVAHFVGLKHRAALRDIDTFELHRSRVPTALFKAIVKDLDLMLVQYGLPREYQTEEVTSRFIAPIFSHLIGLFHFAIKNIPETTLHSCVATKGRIEYQFVTFCGVALVFVAVQRGAESCEEYLSAIAQIIAESQACAWNNAKHGISMPIFGILCDGVRFEFFKFDDSGDTPKFSKGRFSAGLQHPLMAFSLVDPEIDTLVQLEPFIHRLRVVTEIIFDVLLTAYSSSLIASRDQCQAETGEPVKSLDDWEKAIGYDHSARQMFRVGENMRQAGRIPEANEYASLAMQNLTLSTACAPDICIQPLVMDLWDDTVADRV